MSRVSESLYRTGSLNVTLIVVSTLTPVAPAPGTTEATAGRIVSTTVNDQKHGAARKVPELSSTPAMVTV